MCQNPALSLSERRPTLTSASQQAANTFCFQGKHQEKCLLCRLRTFPAVNCEQQLREFKPNGQETSEDRRGCGSRGQGALPTCPGRDTNPSLTTLLHLWGSNLQPVINLSQVWDASSNQNMAQSDPKHGCSRNSRSGGESLGAQAPGLPPLAAKSRASS